MCDDKVYYVYVHIFPNGKLYFGVTCNIYRRWKCKGLYYKSQELFWRAIQKYGWDNIEHIVLFNVPTRKVAGECEKYLIEKYRTSERKYGYNITKGGDGLSGHKHTEETKKKIGDAHRGTHHTEFSKQKMRESLTGRKLSEETKKKMSEARKRYCSSATYVNCMSGKHHSEEVKRRISESNKRTWSQKVQQMKMED